MLEVSITAFKTVLAMDENPNLEERKFDIKVPYGVARAKLQNVAKDADDADIDWLLVEVTGKKRSELHPSKPAQSNSSTMRNRLQRRCPTAHLFNMRSDIASFTA